VRYRVLAAGELVGTARTFSVALSTAVELDADSIIKVDARRPLDELSRFEGDTLELLKARRRAVPGWTE
jgi:hypothetical protein